jgi:D-alanyl-D-alanine carboxypeptidase
MKRAHFLIAAGLAVTTLNFPSNALGQDLSAVEGGLQALLDSVVEAGSTPGIMMRLDVPSLDFSWSGVSGVSDIGTGTPLTRANPVRIASNTKTYVAAAILRLWEEGRLGLDDPLSTHLPAEYAEMLAADGYDLEAITIRHLLTHTSGLHDYADRDLFIEAILADPTHRWTPAEQIGLAVEWGDPYGEPGEVYRYSDTGYVVLGLVLESVYGKPLAASLRELLDFEGLGMTSTWMETLEDPPAGAADRAHQYLGELDTYDFDPSLDLYGGGGLVSTADDMAVFMRALFIGGVYQRASTADTMLTTVTGAKAGPDLSGSPMVPGRYRMGVEVRDLGGLEVYMHTGFWGTIAAYFPGQDIALSIAVTQQQSSALFRVFIDALALLEEAVAAAPAGD